MRTLAGWIERHAAFTPDKPALLAAAAGTVLSYRALAARIGGLSAWLERERGLNAGARVAWLGHVVTNWMGNAGFLRRLNVMVLRHNLIGDTTWCRGRVTGKSAGGVVSLALDGTNQRGEVIASGMAEVVLPAR